MSACTLMRASILISGALMLIGAALLWLVEHTGWLALAPYSLPLVLSGPPLVGVALVIALIPQLDPGCA